MVKFTLKLLVLAVTLVTLAALCGGWKWKSGHQAAAHDPHEYVVGHVQPLGWTWE